ncbi:MAG: hypothetical protein JWL69_1739 [Phycisphaerales bacterium]|nr:hypothetical protein [Phycisphaerales bacterium]
MPSCKRLASSIAIVVASASRADDFKEENSKAAVHAPDG